MPDCFVFAELNGKLRSEASSQQESFFIPWWWIFVRSHDLVESLTKVLVPAQSFGCLLQLLNVFSFCMWDDERLGLLHWNKSSTKRSAHSVKGTNQRKTREHTSHAIITTESLARDELTIAPTASPYCFQGRKMLTARKHIFFFFTGPLLYLFPNLQCCVETDLTSKTAILSTGLGKTLCRCPFQPSSIWMLNHKWSQL